ncbi:MAG: hypothetical protein Q7K03_08240 [Dehalococcoidia bacterium]|nr:hypothetical protein [Dehalococcoidia bacterium]
MIQYEWAKRAGQAIQIESAERGSEYTCIGCGNRMVARKGKVKAHHFGHFPGVLGVCSPETVLHINTKYNLAATFQAALGHPYKLIVRCAHNFQHSVDLLKDVESVETEKSVGDFRPDISLLTSKGDVKRVVEVVVTHSPDIQALSFYYANQIPVYAVEVSRKATISTNLQGQEFHLIDNGNSDRFYHERTIPQYEKEHLRVYSHGCACSGYYYEVDIYRFKIGCYRCHKETPVVYVENKTSGTVFGEIGPKELQDDFIQKYAFVKPVFSQTQNQTVVGNVCTSCGAYNGNFFVWHAWIDQRGANDLRPIETKGFWSQASPR